MKCTNNGYTVEHENEFLNLLISFTAGNSEECCRELFESSRWKHNYHCIICNSTNICFRKTEGRYKCNNCGRHYSVRTNTLLHKTLSPLSDWLLIMKLLLHYKDQKLLVRELITYHCKIFSNTITRITRTLIDANILEYDNLYEFLDHFFTLSIKRDSENYLVQKVGKNNSGGALIESQAKRVYSYAKNARTPLKIKIWDWLKGEKQKLISSEKMSISVFDVSPTQLRRALKEMMLEGAITMEYVSSKQRTLITKLVQEYQPNDFFVVEDFGKVNTKLR